MATKNDPTWETIAENCANDAGCTPSVRELVRALAKHLREQDRRIQELENRVDRAELASAPPHTREHWDMRARIEGRKAGAESAPGDLQARQIAALRARVRSLEHSRNPETWEDPEDFPTT